MDENTKKRITAYYELLAQKENNPSAAKTMKNMVEQLTDEEAAALEQKLSGNDAMYKRLKAYATAFSSMMVAEPSTPYGIDEQGKNAKAMNELQSAFGNYDTDQDISEEINGNTFTYKKTFPIEEYREELAAIGNEETGNQWYVKLDDEGRLVIY
ncbi:hypothetical protein [Chordicoccus furentiruminis]|uniref:hypothetical protein n=1 Tax=Chordicoccus furentiruminis TaxID=2709410 RepID=UPI0023A8EC37|nr:hypothetical protein [Chordicoccus furentiruminis]